MFALVGAGIEVFLIESDIAVSGGVGISIAVIGIIMVLLNTGTGIPNQIATYPASLLNLTSYNQVCNQNNLSYAHKLEASFPKEPSGRKG